MQIGLSKKFKDEYLFEYQKGTENYKIINFNGIRSILKKKRFISGIIYKRIDREDRIDNLFNRLNIQVKNDLLGAVKYGLYNKELYYSFR